MGFLLPQLHLPKAVSTSGCVQFSWLILFSSSFGVTDGFRPLDFSVPVQIKVKAINRGPAVPEQQGKLEEKSYLAPNIIKSGALLLLFCFTCLL